MKKTPLSLKLGIFSGSHVPERHSQGNMIRGGVMHCSKLSSEMGHKGITHTKSKTMLGSQLTEDFMKKSYRRSLPISIIR